MKRNFIALGVLAILVAMTLLAGCSSDFKSTAATTAPATTSATTTSPATTTVKTTSPSVTTTTAVKTTTTSPTTTTTTTASKPLSELLGQAASYPTVKYDMITSGAGQPKMTVTYWMKQPKIRMVAQGSEVVTLMDLGAKTMYMYTPSTNTALKITFDPALAPEDSAAIMQYTPKVVGTETVDGKVCTLIQYDYGKVITKEWIWNDKGFPVRVESTSEGNTAVTEWKNFDFSDIPDSMFTLPKDAQIISLS